MPAVPHAAELSDLRPDGVNDVGEPVPGDVGEAAVSGCGVVTAQLPGLRELG